MRENQRRKGAAGEAEAAEYLTAKGVQIVERNFRCKSGEVDLIGKDGAYLVFFEVKWRGAEQAGFAAEAVDHRKQRRICAVADYYLYQQGLGEELPVRFDVVALDGERTEWFQNAFDYCGKGF
ncbi:MAG: YraN family protein [Lachnospiraceae bacterium]|nr:YraN family protein [Lachnospiraceae bacterium]